MRTPDFQRRIKQRGFTVVELLASVALLATLMLALSAVTESTSRAWREGNSRTETFQNARSALELMVRELTPAVVDTRTQFVIAPGEIISKLDTATALDSPVMLWLAPVGEDGGMRCLGYYLQRVPASGIYRLKRIHIAPPEGPDDKSYFPRMIAAKGKDYASVLSADLRPDPGNANWFTRYWDSNAFKEFDASSRTDNEQAIVSTATDNIVAFWAQPIDLLGNPVPRLSVVASKVKHPTSKLFYNSAAYFQFATTVPFEKGSTVYMPQFEQAMKANRVPAAVDLTIVTLDSGIFARGIEIPTQTNVITSDGVLDVEASIEAYEANLKEKGIHTARVFSTRARLVNGT